MAAILALAIGLTIATTTMPLTSQAFAKHGKKLDITRYGHGSVTVSGHGQPPKHVVLHCLPAHNFGYSASWKVKATC